MNNRTLNMLIVDDNEMDRHFYKHILKKEQRLNFNIKEAETIAECIDVLKEKQTDCLLLDHHLPDGIGEEVITHINNHYANHYIAIIMLTGQGDEIVAVNALKKGACDYINKNNINKKSLLNAIFSALESSASLRKANTKNQQLEALAYQDSLTGLLNRPAFNDKLVQAMEQARKNETLLAMLFIDLDNFKLVNDNYGHQAGDKLLQTVTHYMQQAVRNTDIVARLGGDEFAIILADIKNRDNIIPIVEKIIQSIHAYHIIANLTIPIGASIGISLYQQNKISHNTFIEQADKAMYEAKKAGKSTYKFYQENMT